MSRIRNAGAELLRLLKLAADPGGTAGEVQIYPKDVAGVTQLFAQAGDGTVSQLTPLGGAVPAGVGTPWYGDGADGALVFDGAATVTGIGGMSLAPAASVYTLTRDLYATDLSVSTGVTILASGFRIFCTGTLTLTGTANIKCDGGNGSAGAGNAGGNGGTRAIGFSGVLADTAIGLAGAPQNGGGSVGNNPTNTHLGRAAGTVAGGASGANAGGNGSTLQGGGGGGGDGNNGGGSPAQTPSALNADGFHTTPQLISGRNVIGGQMGTGSSGGSGAGGASGGTAGGGGGSGAAGGTIVIGARLIAGAGTIQALGGNGGDGEPGAGGGGGGGGSGGVIGIVTDSAFPLSVAVSVAGGSGGAAGNGSSGAGGTGGTGLYYEVNGNR